MSKSKWIISICYGTNWSHTSIRTVQSYLTESKALLLISFIVIAIFYSSSKKAQISNEQTFEGIMTGYKTDIETVSWTLDDPLFSFDSGQPKNDVLALHKIINVSTTTMYTWKNIIIVVQGSMRWKSTLEDGRLSQPPSTSWLSIPWH